ncbi:serine protease [Paenibacillus sp. CAA11]|uniref:S1C family serine protease n=1 Tax=Paenibacillus sp. CAA11 TaxID=1532905 RepID=UPI000D3CF3DA|nr:trypsin-like peptidase domain-containing protein [Paenibacillus sp. CAA11]AWB43974.1 serine protease [Paenibacillus sp. CAA11]
MDDQNKKTSEPFGEDENRELNKSENQGSSYYYSYGSFQSFDRDPKERNTNDMNEERDNHSTPFPSENVEITPPEPVRPMPTSYPVRPSNKEGFGQADQGGNGGQGHGNDSGKNPGNWQYNRKPKSGVKSIIAGVLAGMVIMTGAMAYADHENIFTGGKAATTAAVLTSSVDTANTQSTKSSATTAALPISNPGDVTTVVKQAGPAVVQIETLSKSSGQSSSSGGSTFDSDPFYKYFFGDNYFGGSNGGGNNGSGNSGNSGNSGSGSSSSQLVPTGLGSGFIFDKEGYILTNEHVVHGADVVQVTVQGTTKPYEAKVLGKSYDLDLAVLKINGSSSFPSIPLGDSNNSQVGEWMVAIGNPQGFDHTVTSGVLSAKGREITIAGENGEKDRKYKDLLQTDASINPGNSGGPLLNLNGEVIGINVAVSSDAQGIGFAIPTSTITEVLDKLKNNEAIPATPEPFIGATLQTVTPEVSKQMGTDVTEGSLVVEVMYKSPAYNADLRPYDIITGANGQSYSTNQELIAFIQKQKVGDKVTLNIIRNGKKMDLSVTIGNKNDFQTQTTQQ